MEWQLGENRVEALAWLKRAHERESINAALGAAAPYLGGVSRNLRVAPSKFMVPALEDTASPEHTVPRQVSPYRQAKLS